VLTLTGLAVFILRAVAAVGMPPPPFAAQIKEFVLLKKGFGWIDLWKFNPERLESH
jgi:hypothetical protein